MKIDSKHFTRGMRRHFGIDGVVNISINKNPRKGVVSSFVFCDNTVKKGDSFFGEISQVLELLGDNRIGENIDVTV